MIEIHQSLGNRVDCVIETLRQEITFSKKFQREFPSDSAGTEEVIGECEKQIRDFRVKIEALITEYQI